MKMLTKTLAFAMFVLLAQVAVADEAARVTEIKGVVQQVDMQRNRIKIGRNLYVLPADVGAMDHREGGVIGQNHLQRGTLVRAKVLAGKAGELSKVLEMEILQYPRR